MGAEAALAVLDASAKTAPCVICLDGNKITKRPLMECVETVTLSFMNIKSNSSLIFLYKRKTKIWFYLVRTCVKFLDIIFNADSRSKRSNQGKRF